MRACVRLFVRLILLMGVFTSNMCIVFRVNEVAYFKSEVKFEAFEVVMRLPWPQQANKVVSNMHIDPGYFRL